MRWFSLPLLVLGLSCTPLTEERPADAPATSAAPDAAAGPAGPAGPYVVVPATARQAPLFADDLATLRKRVFELVSKQGVPLAKLEEVDALAAIAQSGRTRADGPVCAAPSTLDALIVAKYGRVPQVELRASCQGGACKLHLDIARPPVGDGAWEYVDRFVAPVDQPATLDGWLAALDKLGPIPATKGDMLGSLGSAAHRPVDLVGVTPLGDWKEAPRVKDFEPLQPALDRCFEAGWASSSQDAIRLSFGADGAVQRCEVEPAERHGSDARVACLCDAAKAARAGAGPDGRRVELEVLNAPQSGLDARGVRYAARFDTVTSSDHTEVRPQLADGGVKVATCAAAMGLGAPVSLRVHLDVDASGHVVAANTSATSDALRMCLIANLRTLSLPCGFGGGAYGVDGVLSVWGTPQR